jgi:AraC family transcriptional regulator, regulatory protein of adaptative response / methylated-DNA-[protein]-cysteine methyltransferase
MTLDPTRCWSAVAERDARYAAAFVYAVRSTGVYCRPTCPAKRPARRNVTFYASPAAAADAGYRPCKRCHPDRAEAGGLARSQAIGRYLEAHYREPITLETLAARFGLSPAHLQRTFKAHLGVSPKTYLEHLRRRALQDELRAGERVLPAIYGAGYNSPNGSGPLGMSPGRYRQQGNGATIAYTVAQSPLGTLLVAATPQGVCAVALGDREEALERDLKAQFSQATLTRDDAALRAHVAAILAYLAGRTPDLALPRDVRGTAFQAQVWAALQAIPYGETRSYREVAAAIGKPKAVRAVAGACARNPTALLVPCHRVVSADGDTGGYRWGPERKRALLALERSHPDA